MNGLFLKLHQQNSQDAYLSSDIHSVLVYLAGEMTLWKKQANSYRQVASSRPTRDITYTRSKVLSHTTVTMTMLLDRCINSSANHNENMQLVRLEMLPLLNAILDCLEELEPDDVPPVRLIMEETRNCAHQLLQFMQPHSSQALMKLKIQYDEKMQEPIEYFSKKAADKQKNCLDKLMRAWERWHQLKPETSRVVIVCAHGPREGLIEATYFERWYKKALGDIRIKDNMLYVHEMLPVQFAGVDIKRDVIDGFLRASELNKVIGKSLLGGSEMLFRDALAGYVEPEPDLDSDKIAAKI